MHSHFYGSDRANTAGVDSIALIKDKIDRGLLVAFVNYTSSDSASKVRDKIRDEKARSFVEKCPFISKDDYSVRLKSEPEDKNAAKREIQSAAKRDDSDSDEDSSLFEPSVRFIDHLLEHLKQKKSIVASQVPSLAEKKSAWRADLKNAGGECPLQDGKVLNQKHATLTLSSRLNGPITLCLRSKAVG